jgi:hypothetical protein
VPLGPSSTRHLMRLLSPRIRFRATSDGHYDDKLRQPHCRKCAFNGLNFGRSAGVVEFKVRHGPNRDVQAFGRFGHRDIGLFSGLAQCGAQVVIVLQH